MLERLPPDVFNVVLSLLPSSSPETLDDYLSSRRAVGALFLTSRKVQQAAQTSPALIACLLPPSPSCMFADDVLDAMAEDVLRHSLSMMDSVYQKEVTLEMRKETSLLQCAKRALLAQPKHRHRVNVASGFMLLGARLANIRLMGAAQLGLPSLWSMTWPEAYLVVDFVAKTDFMCFANDHADLRLHVVCKARSAPTSGAEFYTVSEDLFGSDSGFVSTSFVEGPLMMQAVRVLKADIPPEARAMVTRFLEEYPTEPPLPADFKLPPHALFNVCTAQKANCLRPLICEPEAGMPRMPLDRVVWDFSHWAGQPMIHIVAADRCCYTYEMVEDMIDAGGFDPNAEDGDGVCAINYAYGSDLGDEMLLDSCEHEMMERWGEDEDWAELAGLTTERLYERWALLGRTKALIEMGASVYVPVHDITSIREALDGLDVNFNVWAELPLLPASVATGVLSLLAFVLETLPRDSFQLEVQETPPLEAHASGEGTTAFDETDPETIPPIILALSGSLFHAMCSPLAQSLPLLRALLERDADGTVRAAPSSYGQTPYELAIRVGWTEGAVLLRPRPAVESDAEPAQRRQRTLM